MQIAAIGLAGENQVHYASIVSSGNRVNGRTGMGAVMGSKNLKAVVVKGSKKTPYYDEDALKNAKKDWQTFIGEAPLTKNALKEYGTPALVNIIKGLSVYSFTYKLFFYCLL